MKKDVIYIDIEDDITAIIEKVKSATAKIVALVPPKRSTVLNSAVNMKLLQRTAEESKKQIVLVTSEMLLKNLASGAGMYVTSNLHSKPAIPEPVHPEPESANDAVIDGNQIDTEAPVGELAGMQAALEGAGEGKPPETSGKKTMAAAAVLKNLKIPSFDLFRSRLLLIVAAVVVLGAAWWWAFFIAPRATVTIEARATKIDVDLPLTIDAGGTQSDLKQRTLAAKQVMVEKTLTEAFTPSGKKNTGDKASGSMTVQNCDTSTSFTLSAGTIVTSPGGLKFEMLSSAAVPGGSFSGGSCSAPGEVNVTIRAIEPGTQYNLAIGVIYDIDTVGSLVVGYGGQLSGGTDRNVTVVAQKDVDDAAKRLKERQPDNALNDLKTQLGADYIAINETYAAKVGETSSQPLVGEEASSGNVTAKVTYTLLALPLNDLKQLLEEAINTQIQDGSLAILDNGMGRLSFVIVKALDADTFEITANTSAFTGPSINTEQLAKDIQGMSFSEVRTKVEALPGVVGVDVDFQPFWVFTTPAADRITINFSLKDSNQ